MPNRYIREAAIESEAVNSVSWHAEVFYRRLLNRVDDFGRFSANTSLLRASIFPLQLNKVSETDIERLLNECEQSGLIFRYSDGSKVFLIVNKWEQGRAKKSQYPDPPPNICERMQTFVYRCSQMSPTPTPTPTPTPPLSAREAEPSNGQKPNYAEESPSARISPSAFSDRAQQTGRSLPQSLDTVPFRAAWDRWCAYLAEVSRGGRGASLMTLEAHLQELAKMGSVMAVQAIENAISAGLRKPCLPLSGASSKPSLPTVPMKVPCNDPHPKNHA